MSEQSHGKLSLVPVKTHKRSSAINLICSNWTKRFVPTDKLLFVDLVGCLFYIGSNRRFLTCTVPVYTIVFPVVLQVGTTFIHLLYMVHVNDIVFKYMQSLGIPSHRYNNGLSKTCLRMVPFSAVERWWPLMIACVSPYNHRVSGQWSSDPSSHNYKNCRIDLSYLIP